MMKAQEVLREICLRVRVDAPGKKGAFIRITEKPGSPNWTTNEVALDTPSRDKYARAVAELQQSTPIVDWNDAPAGRLRYAGKFVSEA